MTYCITAKREDIAKVVLAKLKHGYSRYKRIVPIGGLEISLKGDGHWLHFKSDKKFASICVENITPTIVRSAIISWIEDQFSLVSS